MSLRRYIRSCSETLAFLALVAGPLAAQTPIDRIAALTYFGEADAMGRAADFWSVPLQGPLLFASPVTREVVANGPDAGGLLREEGPVWVGRLPDDVGIFNGALEWSGTRWTMVMWPLPAGRWERGRLIAHELFHRVQPDLGIPGANPANGHLEDSSARSLLRLEWRALQAALGTEDTGRTRAIADALGFRALRRTAYPAGAEEERALELNEGLAEYAGVVAAVPPAARNGWAARSLDMAEGRARTESVVRNFAYASGPAYGLLLDNYSSDWRRGLSADSDLGALLARAAGVQPAAAPDESLYAGVVVRREEAMREEQRAAQLAEFRTRFIDGPTLTLPVTEQFGYTFNPNSAVSFEPHGTVYLSATIRDAWGTLSVSSGGVLLVRENGLIVRVVLSADPDGWTLTLADGWERAGDTVRRRQ
jgi:hypothetical protein